MMRKRGVMQRISVELKNINKNLKESIGCSEVEASRRVAVFVKNNGIITSAGLKKRGEVFGKL